MSVLIRGMEMPDNCSQCDAEWEDENPYGDTLTFCCPFIYKGYTDDFRSERRHNDCPLVELPPKHGRLVDADALMEKESAQYENVIKGEDRDWFDKILADLIHKTLEVTLTEKNAPTVLEAEGDE